jgi:GT2 family glycosyltransferase
MQKNWLEEVNADLVESIEEHGGYRPSPAVSVVVLTHARDDELLACLDRLRRQTAQDFDIIVADNASPKLPDLSSYPLKHVRLRRNIGTGGGRNAGATASQAKAVVFLDDDVMPDEDLVGSYARLLEDPSVYAARGRVLPRSRSILNYVPSPYDLGDTAKPSPLSTEGNAMVRRRHLLDVGGWRTGIFGFEGLDLSFRLAEIFGREGMIYHPDAVVYHDVAHSLRYLLSKRMGFVETRKEVFADRPELKEFVAFYPKNPWRMPDGLNRFDRARLQLILKACNIVTGPPSMAKKLLTAALRLEPPA